MKGDNRIEQSVIGCLILDNKLIEYCNFTDEDFLYSNNYIVYKAIKELKTGVDLVTLSSHLKNKGLLEQVGGNPALVGYTTDIYSSNNFDKYKQTLLKYSAIRRLSLIGEKLNRDIATTENIDELIVETINNINLTGDKLHSKQDTTVDQIESTLNYIESTKDGTLKQFPLGEEFAVFNRAIGGGIEPGKVYRIGGGSNIGKSWLMYNLGLQTLQQGARVFYATLENKAETTLLNFFSHKKGVNPNKQKIKEKDIDFSDEVVYFTDKASDFKILFGEKNIYNILREAQKFKPDILFIDYIQLARVPGKFNSEKEKLDEYAFLVQDFAVNNNVAIVDLSQMSNSAQGANNTSGQAAELKGSGGLKEAADVVIHLYKDELNSQTKEMEIKDGIFTNANKNFIYLRLSKNRDGGQIPPLPYVVDFDKGGKYIYNRQV